jgi:hypothetical protein
MKRRMITVDGCTACTHVVYASMTRSSFAVIAGRIRNSMKKKFGWWSKSV